MLTERGERVFGSHWNQGLKNETQEAEEHASCQEPVKPATSLESAEYLLKTPGGSEVQQRRLKRRGQLVSKGVLRRSELLNLSFERALEVNAIIFTNHCQL